jgi:DNA-binding transcriptional ArsR family regulator
MREFAALADPTRRRIVELLSGGERAAGELVDQFDVSAPAISQHLKTLRDAGLVQVRIDAQRRIYALDPAGLAKIDAWLKDVRKFWGPRLDALERELRASDPDTWRSGKPKQRKSNRGRPKAKAKRTKRRQ